MSRQLSELCTLLVDEFAGSLASTVFSVLVAHGSLSLPRIVHLSKLNPRHAKNVLALLLQRQLITHDDSPLQSDRTHYQANLSSAYRLVRAGKYAYFADTYIGKDATFIVQHVQERGFVAANELSENVGQNPHAATQTTVDSDVATHSEHATPLDDLFRSNHLVLARPRDLIFASALKEHVEADVTTEEFSTGITGIAGRRSFEKRVSSILKRKRDDNQASTDDLQPGAKNRHPLPDGATSGTLHNHENEPNKTNGVLGYPTQVSINGHSNSNTINPKENGQIRGEDVKNPKRRKLAHTAESETPMDPVPTKGRKMGTAVSNETVTGRSQNSPSQRSKRRKLNSVEDSEDTFNDANAANNEHHVEVHSHPALHPALKEQVPDARPNIGSSQRNVPAPSYNVQTDSKYANEQPFFRLSEEKFDVSMRSQFLTDFCLNCLGEPTSRVYASLLHCSEADLRRCHDDLDANESDIGQEMESDEGEQNEEAETGHSDAQNGILAATIASALDPKVELYVDEAHTKDKPNMTGASNDLLPDSTSNPTTSIRTAEVEYHLHILAEHEYVFVYPVTFNGQERWRVDFARLTALMIQREMQNIITTRFDEQSARITRILLANGKMEEKYLANTSLIKQKDIRVKLALMQEAGFLDVQEIPRDAARQPSRTFYLWFFDQERCRNVVLNDTYQMMARVLQRMHFERKKARGVLDKASRTDVVGREDELLNDGEKVALRELERKEEKLWVQLSRLDDLVALLRDFM